jgi:predicted DNA-binding transcriptional regulator AlpA
MLPGFFIVAQRRGKQSLTKSKNSGEIQAMPTTTEQRERLLRVPAAADRIGFSRAALYGLCYAGKIRHVRLPGTGERENIRIPESALDELIARGTVGGD